MLPERMCFPLTDAGCRLRVDYGKPVALLLLYESLYFLVRFQILLLYAG